MPHRQFLDTDGSAWAVWEVRPSILREAIRGYSVRPDSSARIDRTLASGWLCFESGDRKRRLAPIPLGWEVLTTQELQRLCQTAIAVRSIVRDKRSGEGEQTQP